MIKMEELSLAWILIIQVFNLHEKISKIDQNNKSLVKTQLLINFKITKSFFKIKKKFQFNST